MADEDKTPPKKGERRKSEPSRSAAKPVRVLVDLVVPIDNGTGFAMQRSAELGASGFQLDQSFDPVPAGEVPDAQLAQQLETERNQIVTVRGSIDGDKIDDLRAQDNVLEVWEDTQIAPYSSTTLDDETIVEPSMAPGNCPIPPCDCDQGTAACSKGSMNDVARYLGVDKIWAAGYRGNGIVVAIVDGGISAAGRVAGGTIPRVIGGWPLADWGKKALWGQHGNMTATDALGMAPQAQIYDIRISDGNAISNALAGFEWAINRHKQNGTPHILSNSWGIWQEDWDRVYARNPNHPFTRKVVEAINEGILVLFAAGNCGEGCSPSSKCGSDFGPGKSIWGANGHPKVMTVGAGNIQGRLVGYSSQGPAALDPRKPDFCGISHFRGFFSCDTGTSAACPIVAGVVALLKQCKPSLTQDAAKQALKNTATNIGPAGWDQHSGSGIINAKKAFDSICARPQPDCRAYLVRARRYQALYRRTGNRRYLCLYYRYAALYYRCRYRATRQRRHLCAYYRFLALYYRCQYRITRNRRYLCLYYRNLAAYYRCRYAQTRNRADLTRYRRYLLAYRRCVRT